jgi:hypothetical protein
MPAPVSRKEQERIARVAQSRNITMEQVLAKMEAEEVDEDEAAEGIVADEVLGMMFRGKKCTKDCSGHKAGYAWKVAGKGNKYAKSASFDEGYKS